MREYFLTFNGDSRPLSTWPIEMLALGMSPESNHIDDDPSQPTSKAQWNEQARIVISLKEQGLL